MHAAPPSTAPPGSTPPNWYPDPARRHEVRYFDGRDWTDHVGDHGTASTDPLGALPAGMLRWPEPALMVARGRPVPSVDVPRRKMWVLALLSVVMFQLGLGDVVLSIPIGIAFAVWCWHTTARPLAEHRRAGSSVTEILVARWIAVALAVVCVLQVVAATA